LKANQIILADNLHALAFFLIAIMRTLLRHRRQVITSSRSNILFSDREVNNLPFESAGLPGAVISSPKWAKKQERRRAYCRKRSARTNSPQFKCGPAAVEPRSITASSSGFTDCESASSDSETATCNKSLSNSNFDCDDDSDIDSISSSEK